MRQLLTICTLLLLASCGSTYDHIESDDILGDGYKDPSLSTYLNQFEEDMGVTIPGHLSISIVDDLYKISNPNVDAVCWSNSRTKVGEKIEIRRSRWEVLSEASREQLLYHELGHCVLNKDHNFGQKRGSVWSVCPSSIMNPYTFTEGQIENCYIPDVIDYLIELRN